MKILEKFVFTMYDRRSRPIATSADVAWLGMFALKQRAHKAIPLQRAADSWPSVDTTKNVVEDVNVMALVSLAQHYAAVVSRFCPKS